jgi:hypothetical protein
MSEKMPDSVKNVVGADRSGYIRRERLVSRLKELFGEEIEVFVSRVLTQNFLSAPQKHPQKLDEILQLIAVSVNSSRTIVSPSMLLVKLPR